MTGPAGQPTQAVFGIFRDLQNLIRNRKPDYLAAAFDGPGRVFRSDLFPEYKAQRAAMPEDLVPQIAVVQRVFEGFKVPVLVYDGMEADDVIATLARRGEERGLDVLICTADKDARQLIGDHIRVLNLRNQKLLDRDVLKADWGVAPSQVVDLLALTGDTSDNVPGVPGIGLKTGAKLLEEFGTLENLLANADKVSGAKRKENLRDFADAARLAQKLITLRDDLPLQLDWDALKLTPFDAKALRTLCVECGFHTFLNEIGPEAAEPAVWEANYRTIDTPELLQEFVAELEKQPRFCLDTETTDVDPLRADPVGLSFSWKAGEAYYLPVKAPIWCKQLDPRSTVEALRPALTNPATEKIGQNIKYDMHVLERLGIELAGPITDTMVLSYLLESGERNHDLDQLSQRFLNHKMIPITDLIGKAGKKQTTMDQVEVSRVAEYAGEDADATWQLEGILAPKVRDEQLWDLYANLERPLISVLAHMESAGIKVDVPLLKRLSKEFGERLDSIENEIYSIAGKPFNIASTPQLRDVLYVQLKLPVLQKTPGGEASTKDEVLEELALLHPLPRHLREHRQLSKLKSTYLDALPGLVHPGDGRVHASFNQGVAATGRLSSSDPNLQNIPVRTEDGRQIRQAFVAGFPGWSLLTADYSQIELRVLAHYSGDPSLASAFAQDHDIHAAVAARIFRVAEAEVTSEQRNVAKTVNFGVLYGQSAYGLSKVLGIKQSEANEFIESYFREYAGVDAFITRTLEAAKSSGRVETILGRRRPINGIANTTGHDRNQAERTAVNTVIQGSAADLIKSAMIAVDRRIRAAGLKARMLLQIHDELVFEAPDDEMPELVKLVREAMTTALDLKVPLKVDLGVGPNWLDVVTVE